MPSDSADLTESTLRVVQHRATLTVPEAAQILGISRSTAYELARVGTLPVLRLGRRLVVPTRALAALLESGTETAGAVTKQH